jgi:hypothetical protein
LIELLVSDFTEALGEFNLELLFVEFISSSCCFSTCLSQESLSGASLLQSSYTFKSLF